MKTPISRRHFLATTGAAAATLAAAPTLATAASSPHQHSANLGWKISVQQWTYRRVPLFQGMKMAAEVGLRCFEPRSILLLDEKRPNMKADENIPAAALKDLKLLKDDLGIACPSVYADFNGQPDQARKLLEFWKDLGVTYVVSEPPINSIDMLDPLFAEFGMQLALHNHQRTKSEYWHPGIVLDLAQNRGKHVGACCDVGQWARSDLKPVECLQKIGIDRMVSFHLKDVLTMGDLECRNTVIGEGAADCATCLAEIHKLGYRALVTIDFEHDTPRIQEDMRKNIAFIEAQAKQLAQV
jgi:L-ribulose-5-phosphate 3-epimerase